MYIKFSALAFDTTAVKSEPAVGDMAPMETDATPASTQPNPEPKYVGSLHQHSILPCAFLRGGCYSLMYDNHDGLLIWYIYTYCHNIQNANR